jgi:hypothetical protein
MRIIVELIDECDLEDAQELVDELNKAGEVETAYLVYEEDPDN